MKERKKEKEMNEMKKRTDARTQTDQSDRSRQLDDDDDAAGSFQLQRRVIQLMVLINWTIKTNRLADTTK